MSDTATKGAEKDEIKPLNEVVRKLIFQQNNDVGNANRFEINLEAGDQRLIYVIERKEWYYWNGTRWVADKGNAKVTRLFIGMLHRLIAEVKKADWRHFHKTDERAANGHRRGTLQYLKGSLNRGKIMSAIDMATNWKSFRISSSELDTDPWIVSCANGDLHLKEGKLLDPDPSNLITKQLNVVYNPEAECPRWDQFIDEVTQGNKELAIYIQKFFGYCLTGDTEEHFALNLTGNGSNGKSVLMNSLANVWGDYSVRVPNDVITKQGRGGGGDESKASPQTAMLQGARLALTSELEQSMWIGEAKFKDIVSSDEITARRLHKDPETFVPTHKLVFCGNYQPNIKGNDDGIWRRIKQIVFGYKADNPDKTLPQQFKEEEAKSYILNWVLEGLSLFLIDRKQNMRIREPQCVTDWNKQYRNKEDILLQFLEDVCNVDSNAKSVAPMFRWAYENWALDNGYRPYSTAGLNKDMEQRGFTIQKSNGLRLLHGVELKKDWVEEQKTRGDKHGCWDDKISEAAVNWFDKYNEPKKED